MYHSIEFFYVEDKAFFDKIKVPLKLSKIKESYKKSIKSGHSFWSVTVTEEGYWGDNARRLTDGCFSIRLVHVRPVGKF